MSDFLKNKRIRPALWVLGSLLLLALFRDVLANERPLWCRIQGETFYPGLRTVFVNPDTPYRHPVLDSIKINNIWQSYPYQAAVFAPIAYSPGKKSSAEIVTRPLPPGTIPNGLPARFRHWLGTDGEGHDVAAGMVSGARVAILMGIMAMGIAMLIGIFLGALAGFYGDDRLHIRRGRLWTTLLGLPFAYFYSFLVVPNIFPDWSVWHFLLFFAGIIGLFNGVGWLLSRLPFFAVRKNIPADLLVMRLAEIFQSVPALLIVLAVAALPKVGDNIWLLVVLIGVLSWPNVARLLRGDLLRVREMDFITQARSMGLPEMRILFRHALPNAIRSTLVAFALGVASAILLETALSFLGFGQSSNWSGTTWGSLLVGARSHLECWWLSMLPGLAICTTVLALNMIGEALVQVKE